MHNSKYVNVEINGFRRSYCCVLQILFIDKIGKINNIYIAIVWNFYNADVMIIDLTGPCRLSLSLWCTVVCGLLLVFSCTKDPREEECNN